MRERRLDVWMRLLTVAMDMAMASVSFYLAYLLRNALPIPTPLHLGPFRDYVPQQVIFVVSLLATFFFYRLYHVKRGGSRLDLLYRLLSATSISSLVSTALSFLVSRPDQDLTRSLVIYNWALSFILVAIGRAITGGISNALHRRQPVRLVLVGTGDIAQMVLQKTKPARLGYRVIGFVDGDTSAKEIAGVPVLGSRAELGRIIHDHQAEEVIIALAEASHDELLDMISTCEAERASVRIFPDLFQIVASELAISDLDGLPLLQVRNVALRGWRATVKRVIDVVGSGAALVLLSPLMMLVTLAIRLESKGPVFYAQTRVGLDGKPFPCLKFRSMRVDAEAETGPVWATPDDPRRTRVGEFLRRTSIDELPQLINVLLGEMSLVGPRPERPVFVEQFKAVVPRYMERHKEKAGLTGWAQVNGLRGDTSIVERTKYDLYYIENWSLLFDIKIMVRTVINIFRGDR
ncbi:MAG: undecaprenyl-phosphate glucose phosphotransferase, partial [Anaerolineales bacterium]